MAQLNISEITLNNLIGLKFNLSEIDDLESDFKALYQRFYNEDITLQASHYPHQLVVLKIGCLDLTFKRQDLTENQYLRVLMISKDIGYMAYDKWRAGYTVDEALKNWQVAFDSLEKPLEFKVKDACHTNSEYIWQDKYFYG